MIPDQFSLTARDAALHRAAHQVFEKGAIFRDPLASAVLGLTPEQAATEEGGDESRRRMRLFIAARSRFAEDHLARAVERGVRQAVVLGAGLDTFALRNPHRAAGLRVFEVDHPDTQRWKRERLAAAGIGVPDLLTFVPVDFECDDLASQLDAAGLDGDRPAIFLWLGVPPYLSRQAALATLAVIARTVGAEVAFDYTEGRDGHEGQSLVFHDALAARVASIGEPLVGMFEPEELARDLAALGMTEQEDIDIPEIRRRYFGVPPGARYAASAGHLVWARRPA
jgi:methyltransferase (TIGR00027 family)